MRLGLHRRPLFRTPAAGPARCRYHVIPVKTHFLFLFDVLNLLCLFLSGLKKLLNFDVAPEFLNGILNIELDNSPVSI